MTSPPSSYQLSLGGANPVGKARVQRHTEGSQCQASYGVLVGHVVILSLWVFQVQLQVHITL